MGESYHILPLINCLRLYQREALQESENEAQRNRRSFWRTLTAFGAAFVLPVGIATAFPKAVTYPTFNLKTDCGAKGDGRSDDTGAFQKAARLIQNRGGGTLVIPKATYVVGEQKHIEGQTPYYQTASVFRVEKLGFLRVEGNRATVRFAPGLHYGAFDPKTGEAYGKIPDYDPKYAVSVGVMLDISHSRHVTVRDLDLDGNSGAYVLGGGWGDVGRQLGGGWPASLWQYRRAGEESP